jgi:predicted dinucleotide-binding enzyme
MNERGLSPRNVAVLGSGTVGKVLARAFAQRGHDVMIGSRDPANSDLVEWLGGEGAGVKSGTFADAAAHGEVVVLSVYGVAVESAIELAGPHNLAGKVVIDTTNPLDFSEGFPPKLAWGHTDSGGEHVQRAAPDARVVKALNIVGNAYMVDPRFQGGRPTMFIAGDDAGAKSVVAGVLFDFGWPEPVDCGGIETARLLEPLSILWVKILQSRGGAADHAFNLLVGAAGAEESTEQAFMRPAAPAVDPT